MRTELLDLMEKFEKFYDRQSAETVTNLLKIERHIHERIKSRGAKKNELKTLKWIDSRVRHTFHEIQQGMSDQYRKDLSKYSIKMSESMDRAVKRERLLERGTLLHGLRYGLDRGIDIEEVREWVDSSCKKLEDEKKEMEE